MSSSSPVAIDSQALFGAFQQGRHDLLLALTAPVIDSAAQAGQLLGIGALGVVGLAVMVIGVATREFVWAICGLAAGFLLLIGMSSLLATTTATWGGASLALGVGVIAVMKGWRWAARLLRAFV